MLQESRRNAAAEYIKPFYNKMLSAVPGLTLNPIQPILLLHSSQQILNSYLKRALHASGARCLVSAREQISLGGAAGWWLQ
jgi:hypothetical protein